MDTPNNAANNQIFNKHYSPAVANQATPENVMFENVKTIL
jgi:hypothetical protein